MSSTVPRISGWPTISWTVPGSAASVVDGMKAADDLSLPGRLDRSVDDHERLLTAYADRDAPLAVAITRSIVLGGLCAIEASGRVGLAEAG
jgi:hypothetical protein